MTDPLYDIPSEVLLEGAKGSPVRVVANVPPDDPFVEMMTFLTFDNNP